MITEEHRHWFVLGDPANGRVSGRCRDCGEEREFRSHIPPEAMAWKVRGRIVQSGLRRHYIPPDEPEGWERWESGEPPQEEERDDD